MNDDIFDRLHATFDRLAEDMREDDIDMTVSMRMLCYDAADEIKALRSVLKGLGAYIEDRQVKVPVAARTLTDIGLAAVRRALEDT